MGLLSTIGAASGRAFGLTRVGAAIRDAYFNLTTLLLPGNGTNGAQNNTFLDSSSNNFTITRNGNTTQGTFSPFSQTGWSNNCPVGGTDFINAGTQTAYSFGTGKYTIEFFVYPTAAAAADNTFLSVEQINTGWTVSRNGNTGVALGIRGVGNVVATTSYQVPLNQWTHVVVTRNSTGTNDTRIFINGTLAAVGTDANNWAATGALYLMATGVGGYNCPGYMSNLRLIKGSIPTAYQTSSTTAGASIFTPPTSALTTTSQGTTATDVSLLTCQSNRFIDNSNNGFALTVSGSPSVQAFSPFAPTAAYSAATVGGSGYFDGTGDYLTTPSTAVFNVGTGNFTVETWIYPNSITANTLLFISFNTSNGIGVGFQATNAWGLVNSGVAWVLTTSTMPTVGQWNHLVVCRGGTGTNQTAIFLNGTRVATGTVTTSFSQTSAYGIGYDGANTAFNGYMSSLRVVTSDVYGFNNSTITVPTAPLTAITNTQLLLNYTNAGITDATAKNVLETVGNAQISTTQSKFGGSSMYFDGTGDYLKFPSSELVPFASNEKFTIEGWIYPSVATAGQIYGIYTTRNSGISAYAIAITLFGSPLKINVEIATAGSSLVTISSSTTISANTWYHFAVVHDGTQLKLYLNGTSEGTPATTSQATTLKVMALGRYYVDIDNYYFNGYIDDFRITKGYARYTSNFTPPTAAYALQ